MTNEQKKQFKWNIIKLVIGLILLTISRSYLQKHPAERVSVFSGFEVMIQKADVFILNILGKNGELSERKYGMEKYYRELIKMAENNKCLDHNVIVELEDLYHDLKKEHKDALADVLPEYTKKAYEYENIVKNDDC